MKYKLHFVHVHLHKLEIKLDGIVGRASIIIIACKASYCVVTFHNKLKHLDMHRYARRCSCTHHTNQAVSTYF